MVRILPVAWSRSGRTDANMKLGTAPHSPRKVRAEITFGTGAFPATRLAHATPDRVNSVVVTRCGKRRLGRVGSPKSRRVDPAMGAGTVKDQRTDEGAG